MTDAPISGAGATRPSSLQTDLSRPPSLPRRSGKLRRMGRTIGALILREMGSTYGRSPGGYLWALLEPLGAILLLALGFSLIVRTPALGSSFLLFYATGYLPFQIYLTIANKTATALSFSRPLLAYPRVTWLDTILARVTLNLLTGITVFLTLIFGILAVQDVQIDLAPGPVAAGIAIAALTGLGVGLVNCLLFGLYPVWEQIWSIITRPLFLASGVFFIYDNMPRVAQDILWWNPLLHATGEVRDGFYGTYDAPYVSLVYCFGVVLTLVALGLLLLRRYHKRVLEN